MRMKFNKTSQLLLVSAASLLAAGLVTACATATTDFVYVASSTAAGPNQYGEIDVFEINAISGYMRQIPTSPFPSGGRNPVAETAAPDNSNLYVINQDDSSIVQFLIGSDGKLYPQNTYDTTGNYSASGVETPTGIFPLAAAANGSNLFVLNTYQPLPACSTATPCSGTISVFPILTATQAKALTPSEPADSLGTPAANPSTGDFYWPLSLPGSPSDVLEPTAITVLASGADVYVTAYDATTSANYLFGFAVGSGGVLTALNSGAPLGGGPFATGMCYNAYLNGPFTVGTCPAAIASSGSSYVYVTDARNGTVRGYTVASGTGLLTQLSGSPFAAGNQPSAIAIDPDSSYPFAYVSNAQDGTVSAYSITSGGGLTSEGTYDTGVQPVAIGIDPSANHFVFTANFLGANVSDFELSASTGQLINTQLSPYRANTQLTAVAAIPHHATQH